MSLGFLTAFAREVWPGASEVVMNPVTGDFRVMFEVTRRELVAFRAEPRRVARELADKLRPRTLKPRRLYWGRGLRARGRLMWRSW